MKQQLQTRLNELKSDFERGNERLASLSKQQQELRETLLRINGAILVLQEELEKFDKTDVESEVEGYTLSDTNNADIPLMDAIGKSA